MIPAANRLRSRSDFALAVKGARSRVGALVVHVANTGDGRAPRIGFIASRHVGGSVVRHRVVRRLRAVSSRAIGHLPPGTIVVVRALPAASAQSYDQLTSSFEQALARLHAP